jgi:large subunit ribosomal protein L1
MAKRGKKYRKISESKNHDTNNLQEAIKKAKKNSYCSFNGTIELHVALKPIKDMEAKSIKGSVSLPHSESKDVKIAAFTLPEDEEKAKKAGADIVGMENLSKEIKSGKINFDIAVASPKVMSQIAHLGKELGPKGLMPNPKLGTVTDDFEEIIKEYKKGKTNFAADQNGVIHLAVGKIDQEEEKITENIAEALKAIRTAIGEKDLSQNIKRMHLAPTMGPSVRFEYSE